MGFKEMLEEAEPIEETDSDELSPEQAWLLANRVIATEPDRQQLAQYRLNYRNLRSSLETEMLDIMGDINHIDPDARKKVKVFVDSVLDQLRSQQLYNLLENHTLVGVGGRFSSGKSSFLNAMFMSGSNLSLPEAQDATTSVPTFIIHGTTENSEAHLCNHLGCRLDINAHELAALSHWFYTRFGLSLSCFISFIDITSSQVPPKVIMLDTPGYSKADSDQLDAYSDRGKAYEQLRSVDYLIWAFDISNGTITNEDFEFIKTVAPIKQLLILACKSDLKTETQIQEILEQAWADAENRLGQYDCHIFDIVPFCARHPEQNSDSIERINDFLQTAQQDEKSRTSLKNRMQEQFDDIELMLKQEMYQYLSEKNSIEHNIRNTSQFFSLQLLLELYRGNNEKQLQLSKNQDTINHKESICNLESIISSDYQ